MSASDYELHLSRDRFNSLWEGGEESEAYPFGEDIDEIERMIEEEIGPQRRRRRVKRQGK